MLSNPKLSKTSPKSCHRPIFIHYQWDAEYYHLQQSFHAQLQKVLLSLIHAKLLLPPQAALILNSELASSKFYHLMWYKSQTCSYWHKSKAMFCVCFWSCCPHNYFLKCFIVCMIHKSQNNCQTTEPQVHKRLPLTGLVTDNTSHPVYIHDKIFWFNQ